MCWVGAFGFESLVAAFVAFAVMHWDDVAAAWAPVLFCLAFKELLHALITYGFLVFYHAHPVASLVKLVKFNQPLAGHIGALMTEAELPADLSGAVAFDKRAVFVSNSATATMGYYAFFSWNAMAVGEIGFADAAVNAAGRNEVSCKLGIHKKWMHRSALMNFIHSNQAKGNVFLLGCTQKLLPHWGFLSVTSDA
jgi:hypothetical protein